MFGIARSAGYPLWLAGDPRRHAVEVFPHASAVALNGSLPPHGWKRAPGKKRWRTAILQSHGVTGPADWSIHRVDAALAALTGVLGLEAAFTPVGDPAEGVIMLPIPTLPPKFRRRA